MSDRHDPEPQRRVLGNRRRLLLACAAGGFVTAAVATVWWRRTAAKRAAEAAAPPVTGPTGAESAPAPVEAPPRHQPYNPGRSVGPFRATSPTARPAGGDRPPVAARRPGRRLSLALVAVLLVGAVLGGGAAILATGSPFASAGRTDATPEDASQHRVGEGESARPPATLPPGDDPLPGLEPLPAGSGRGPRPATPETPENPEDQGLWERLFG